MRNFILALPLLFLAPSCETVKAVLGVPVAVVEDVGDGVTATADALTPGEQAAAEQAGQVAGGAATVLTGGNVAVGGTVAVVVTGLATWFFKRRKK